MPIDRFLCRLSIGVRRRIECRLANIQYLPDRRTVPTTCCRYGTIVPTWIIGPERHGQWRSIRMTLSSSSSSSSSSPSLWMHRHHGAIYVRTGAQWYDNVFQHDEPMLLLLRQLLTFAQPRSSLWLRLLVHGTARDKEPCRGHLA